MPRLRACFRHNVLIYMCHFDLLLHSEGVVHGDLKAANVMLAAGGADPDGLWAATIGRPLIAKVADFGLAVSLPESDSHATLTARVRGGTMGTVGCSTCPLMLGKFGAIL